MGQAAIVATADLERSYGILQGMTHRDRSFIRGRRHVKLAMLAEQTDGGRSARVERMVRVGFRMLARWAIANGVH